MNRTIRAPQMTSLLSAIVLSAGILAAAPPSHRSPLPPHSRQAFRIWRQDLRSSGDVILAVKLRSFRPRLSGNAGGSACKGDLDEDFVATT